MNYLEPDEQAKLDKLRQTDASVATALQQVTRILESETFLRVRENGRGFLMFVVAKKLLGSESEIKEVTIAIQVFGKPADYDCSESSTVRVAADSLRGKLAQYYREEGQRDPIEISIPRGKYIPDICDRRIAIGVSTCEDWSPDDGQKHLCDAITDELTYQLRQFGFVEAKRLPILEAKAQSCQYGLRGSLLCSAGRFKLNVSVSDLRSLENVLAETFEGHRDELLKVCRDVARRVIQAIRDGAHALLRRQAHFVGRTRPSASSVKVSSPRHS